MLRRVKLMNPFEIVQDRIPQDRPQPVERKCDESGCPRHAGLRRLWFRRHHLPRHRAMEQRGAGMAARQYLRNQPAHCNTCQHDGNLVWLTLN